MQNNPELKNKVQQIFQSCQTELKRATEIGKKMLNASRENTELHEAYEQLGVLIYKAMKAGELKWDKPKVTELMSVIDKCEKNLESIEAQVQKIKFSAGPESVTADTDSVDKDSSKK